MQGYSEPVQHPFPRGGFTLRAVPLTWVYFFEGRLMKSCL